MHCATKCPYECTYALKIMCIVMGNVLVLSVRMASAAETRRFATPVRDSKELELCSTESHKWFELNGQALEYRMHCRLAIAFESAPRRHFAT